MLFQLGVVLLGIIQFIFQFQTCASFTQSNGQFENNTMWVGTAAVSKLKYSEHHVPGSILDTKNGQDYKGNSTNLLNYASENEKEKAESVGNKFETLRPKAEKQRQKKEESTLVSIVKFGVISYFILLISLSCCVIICSCCEEEGGDSNTRVNHQRNRTDGEISPGAYRIQTQSSGLAEAHSAFMNQMSEIRFNVVTNSNGQGTTEWTWSSSTRGASAPPSRHSPSRNAYRTQTHSSGISPSSDRSPHQVRRNLTPPSSRHAHPFPRVDEPPPSYDQCVLIPTTVPDARYPTAPPEEQEEKQPPYFFK